MNVFLRNRRVKWARRIVFGIDIVEKKSAVDRETRQIILRESRISFSWVLSDNERALSPPDRARWLSRAHSGRYAFISQSAGRCAEPLEQRNLQLPV